MRGIVDKIPLRTKLVLLVIVPLLGMTLFSTTIASDKKATANEAADLDLLINLSVRTGNLLHETQKERGATAVYMASGGEKFINELPNQQAATDTPRAEFLDFIDENQDGLPADVVQELQPALDALEQLDRTRGEALALTAETRSVIGYFTDMNGKFLDAIASVASASSSAELTRDSAAYLAFLNAKERTGIERAQLSAVFGTDAFAPGQYATVVSLISAQAAFLGTFSELAADDVLAFHEETDSDPIVAETARLEALAVDNGAGGFEVDSAVWFDTITARINLLKEVEDYQANRIQERSAAISADASSAFIRSVAVALVLLTITVLLGLTIATSLTGQLRKITALASRITAGDLGGEPLAVPTDDDLGKLARSFNEMQAMLADLVGRLKASSTQLEASAEGLATVSNSIHENAGRTYNEAMTASEVTSTVSTNMTEVAGAIDQMNLTIREISDSSMNAATVANHGVEVAGENSATISKLREASQEIGQVIEMISSIAEKTNLLALNATIEAARAGENGKGFAVVATEVKHLAGQTAEATTQISDRIEAIQEEIGRAVEANSQVSETIDEINEISTTIASAVEEQSITTENIASTIDQAARGSEAIVDSAGQVTHAAEQTKLSTEQSRETAEQMTQVADELSELVSHYQ
ncbi:MAG: methyl-accepting chemotaxis protein [Actinomycetia bacterium]|nr:methyl-accepting chemotaxis protein [Actinomycetes bacterium]MCP5035337.1 methyl-accepting chemotaxis protein [Actinomycetes bacterium]